MTVIRIGAAPPPFAGEARLADGTSAILRPASLAIDEGAGPDLVITVAGQAERRWPLSSLRRLPDQAFREGLVLARKGDPITRLYVDAPEAVAILTARAGDLDRPNPVKGAGRLLAWAAAAVASVALIIFVFVPVMADQLAEYLPPEGEKALGDTTFEQIRTALSETDYAPLGICDAPEGVAALQKMERRLTQGLDLPYPVTVHVLDHELINAFALPGGRIVFFRGLIEAAEHPDEVAAVFAHEIAHVLRRDPTRGALRSAGSIGVLGLLLGDFAGGAVVLFLTERLIEASYSQEAEAASDAFAHERLAELGIPPSAIADMFRRLQEEHGDAPGIVAHFLSHPRLGDRIAAAEEADALLTGPIRPSLGEEDWQALRAICR